MVQVRSLILRNFKPKYFPEGACIVLKEVYRKLKNTILDDDEEFIVTIDNDFNSEQIDCVIFTTKRIVMVHEKATKSVYYKEIDSFEIPEEKVDASLNHPDHKMNRSDRGIIWKKDGKSEEIRIIYGGVYLLAMMIKSTIFNKALV